jgi:hypothetical protein
MVSFQGSHQGCGDVTDVMVFQCFFGQEGHPVLYTICDACCKGAAGDEVHLLTVANCVGDQYMFDESTLFSFTVTSTSQMNENELESRDKQNVSGPLRLDLDGTLCPQAASVDQLELSKHPTVLLLISSDNRQDGRLC